VLLGQSKAFLVDIMPSSHLKRRNLGGTCVMDVTAARRSASFHSYRSRPLFYDNDSSSGEYSSFESGGIGGGSRRPRRRDGNGSDEDGVLRARIVEMRRRELEEGYRRPPNPALQPVEFVSELLRALWNNAEPLPEAGFRLLLRASTKDWRRRLYDAVAAPGHANEEVVASAVGEAMGRPRNQYGILVGEDELYYASFPTDVLDYGDGTCWVECQLRDKATDALLAILGWELAQRDSDGAWLVSQIDWQDFRGTYGMGSMYT
jgi:hypothetical protein